MLFGIRQRFESASWLVMFSYLKAYKREKQHCRVPTKLTINDPDNKKENIPLGNWVSKQRAMKKKLDEKEKKKKVLTEQDLIEKERIRKLDDIGLAWDPKAEKWEKSFAAIRLFIDENGHSLVPQKHQVPDPDEEGKMLPLGSWVSIQRQNKRKVDDKRSKGLALTDMDNTNLSRFARLDSIGFEWDPKSAN